MIYRYFFDHCPISLSLDLNIKSKSETVLASANILTQVCDITLRHPTRIHRDRVNWEAFTNTVSIELRNINTLIDQTDQYNQSNINNLFDNLENTRNREMVKYF